MDACSPVQSSVINRSMLHGVWRVYAFLFSFCVDLIYAFMLLGCQSGVELNGTAPRFDWPHPNGLRCDDGIKFA